MTKVLFKSHAITDKMYFEFAYKYLGYQVNGNLFKQA